MRKAIVISLMIIVISFVISIYFYQQMPEKIASHWNFKGEVDDYMSKFWGLFLMPIISIGLLLLFIFLPNIDPLKENYKKFMKYYDGFVLLIIIFLFYLYLLTIFWNIGFRFSIVQFLAPIFGILFFYIGILIENAKRNWFVGIKTPWTLSNDKVWNNTHKVGGKLFKIIAIIAVVGIFFENYALYFILIPVIFIAVYTIVYSYFEYKKLKNK